MSDQRKFFLCECDAFHLAFVPSPYDKIAPLVPCCCHLSLHLIVVCMVFFKLDLPIFEHAAKFSVFGGIFSSHTLFRKRAFHLKHSLLSMQDNNAIWRGSQKWVLLMNAQSSFSHLQFHFSTAHKSGICFNGIFLVHSSMNHGFAHDSYRLDRATFLASLAASYSNTLS